jgi:molecular chaperone HtpG
MPVMPLIKSIIKALTDETLNFNKDDYFIKISVDKENRVLKISDTGIGMTDEELEENLGVIAKAAPLTLRKKMN